MIDKIDNDDTNNDLKDNYNDSQNNPKTRLISIVSKPIKIVVVVVVFVVVIFVQKR